MGFVGPDEPRYADVARAMQQTGDYVTPRLFGEPWFEKPPLYYWLAAQFFRLDANEIGARLPSALAAVVFLWFWFSFTRKLFGTQPAALAAIMLGSTLGWIGFAHAAVMDMLLAATLDGALLMLGMWFWHREEQHLYLFYVLLGLATLAKGPVAIVLAGMIALAYVVTYRDWKALRQTLLSRGVLLFAVVAVPWYALCYARNGQSFIQEFFVVHNLGRFTSLALGHGQPVWYFLPILAAGLFPWTPMLLLPLADLARSPKALFANRQRTFLFYWAFLTFLFFSLSQNKLPGYVLPILPPLTLWIALIIEGRASEGLELEGQEEEPVSEESAWLPRLAACLIGLSALLLLAVPLAVPLLGDVFVMGLRRALEASGGVHLAAWLKGPVPPAAWILLLIPIAFSLYKLWRMDVVEAAFLVLVGMALCMVGMVQYVSPAINRVASVRTVGQRLRALEIGGDQLAVVGLHRDHMLGLGFYMDHSLSEWNPKSSPSSISYVLAKDGERIEEGRSMILFPGPHLRLWVLPPAQFDVNVQVEPGGSKK